jgi:gliding motility-associatede transport system auxiliary component
MKDQLKKADVFGLVLVASAIISYLIRKDWTIYQSIVLGVGVVLIAVALILKSSEIRTGMGRRSTKFGINSGVSVLILIGVLGLVNYLADRHQKRFDMTTERLHSLGDESVKVVSGLEKDVHIKAFYPGGNEPEVQDLLDLYANQSSKIRVEFIDPDKDPQAAKQYQVTLYEQLSNPLTGAQQKFGTIVLDAGENKIERIEKRAAPTEEDITNALMKVTKGVTKTVYFVEGHGEKAIDSGDRAGYQVADGGLTKDGYKVNKLNLVREEKVPADASVVIMAGPVAEPFAEEMTKLDAYLNAGGSLLLMLDPPPAASLKEFTDKWSVTVGNNRVIDATGMGRLLGKGPDSPLVTSYGQHPIVERFNVMTFFPVVRSVAPAKTPATGLTVEPLLETNSQSWGESDLNSNEVGFDEKVDVKGPVPIAAVVTKDAGEGKKARLIVFGDSDFAINANFSNAGNGNLFINIVKWLARDENLISIKTKDPTDRPITMTESGGRTVGFIAVILLPGAALLSGVMVWLKRRK